MHPLRSDRPGDLPRTATPILGGVTLPPGRTVVPNGDESDTPQPAGPVEPVLWISTAPLPPGPVWAAVAEGFASHGLWPLFLEALDGEPTRPWDDGELDPAGSTAPEDHDAATVLAEAWAEAIPVGDAPDPALDPFTAAFPGLAPATDEEETTRLASIAAPLSGRLGLVAVTRPADAPAVLGWTGPLNHEHDMGRLAAVLRSWEDRFGAYLVALGFDTMTLAVERPPTELSHATVIAAEHFALCPDLVWQGSETIAAHAESLVGANLWQFWWD